MSRFGPERRIPTDLDHRFLWRSRDGYPDAAPTLSVAWPAGTQTYLMSVVRAPDRIAEVSTDGREITIEVSTQPASDLRGFIEELGGWVWIDGGALYQGPARVVRLVSQTAPVAGVVTAVLRLAEPLPAGVQPIDSYTGATGSITVLDASAVDDGFAFSLYGVEFEWAPSPTGTPHGIYYGGAPTNGQLATRIAAAINAEGVGLTATAVGAVVNIVGLGDGVIGLSDVPGAELRISAVSLTGATNKGAWYARWTVYACTLLQAHVGTERLRNVRWTLPWTRRAGGDWPTEGKRDRGFLHISASPFDTGLEDAHLFELVPGWATIVPERQVSWLPQRDAAEDELVSRLRPRLLTGRCEDDVLAEQFRRAHALFTAATIRRGHAVLGYDGAAESAEKLQAMALEALDLAIASLTWLDKNGNGVVDEGETGLVQGGMGSAFYASACENDEDTIAARRSNWSDDR